MKVLADNSRNVKCKFCGSILEIEASDVRVLEAIFELDDNELHIVDCPCCGSPTNVPIHLKEILEKLEEK